MLDSDRRALAEYTQPLRVILRTFVAGTMPVDEFERVFFAIWPDLTGSPSEAVLEASERYFFSVEDHVDDPRLREEGDITTEELKRRTVDFLQLIDVD